MALAKFYIYLNPFLNLAIMHMLKIYVMRNTIKNQLVN
ncbi:hypothetical protein ATCC51562_809 [Campylobacter concisus ATCC 51562]|uniref:Uncharacterized protein n=1 Tax=Campylobacter concisus ATCC 51562 TaxID=1242969 RepID=U2EML6_9BACT|nr:hypothetical protein ATCC51562_809 [Campylobacter concisus ATCC 51562]